MDFDVVFWTVWFDGPPMTNKTGIHLEPLSGEQIQELARYIIDEFGTGLSREELDESIGVVMENIPGLELASTREIRQLTKSIRRQYDDEIRNIRDQG